MSFGMRGVIKVSNGKKFHQIADLGRGGLTRMTVIKVALIELVRLESKRHNVLMKWSDKHWWHICLYIYIKVL